MSLEQTLTQRCGKCKRQRPLELFVPSHRGMDGATCYDCRDQSGPRRASRECNHCGKSYIPKQLRPSSKYCSRKCKDKARHAAQKAELAALKATVTRVCAAEGCDVDISHRRSDTKYCTDACSRASRKRSPEQKRAYRLSSQYGLTQEAHDDLLAQQGGKCAICKRTEPGNKYGSWYVDHCHETGRVRGLLCSPCNTGLGSFYDNPAWLERAADYLEAYINA